MSQQRPQRAAAAVATKANALVLSSHHTRRRSGSQTTIRTINSPNFVKEERYQGGRATTPSSSSLDVMMQQQQQRRADGGPIGSSYNPDGMFSGEMYWPSSDDHAASSIGTAVDQANTYYQQQQFWEEPSAQNSSSDPTHRHNFSYQDQYHSSSHSSFDPNYYPSSAQPSSLLGLKQDSSLNIGLHGNLDLEPRTHSHSHYRDANSSATFEHADSMALLDSLPFKESKSSDPHDDSYEDSTDSDLPPEKKKLSAAFRPRGRKKRNKCSPDQLRSLEAFFEKNRNPTGRIRLELSRKLRMPERSVQVWFQNRRAKVKTIERRGDGTSDDPGLKKDCSIRLDSKDAYPRSPIEGRRDGSGGGAGQDMAPSVTAIPTSALCIGTWRRVSPLICFFSRRLQSLTWYLTSESIGFKLEIPWTSIRSAYFDGPSNPSIAERAEGVRVPLGHFVIDLERPPTFFMEVFRSAPVKNSTTGAIEEQKVSWRQCEDFTEDHQAMTVSRHILNGPYEELRSAVQALARCNDVLQRLIKFHDTDRRAAGAVPTGSGSTADNFGLIGTAPHHQFITAAAPFTPIDAPAASPFAPSLDLYGNPTMPMPLPLQPAAMSSASSLPKSSAWQNFRTPIRGPEPGWEFDSPASVSTNLSEPSLDSNQRLGYSPYGVPTNIEASPRGGLGGSMDLNSLRIDMAGGGMGSFSSGAGISGVMGGDNGLDGVQGGWDGRLGGCEMQPQSSRKGGQGEDECSLANSGILEGNQGGGHSMQIASSPDGHIAMHQVHERRSYPNDNRSQHQPSTCISELPQTQDRQRSIYNGMNDDPASSSNSLFLSRDNSHNDTSISMHHQDNPQGVDPTCSNSRRGSFDHPASASSTMHSVSVRSFDEDAFSGKTPTYRTSFNTGPSNLQMSLTCVQANESESVAEAQRGEHQEGKEEGTAQGRSRSNTYRQSTHGGGHVSLSNPSMKHGEHQSSDSRCESTDIQILGGEAAALNEKVAGRGSPGLLSLGTQDLSNERHTSTTDTQSNKGQID
ncbi:uncharacterized protein MEPE_05227 [Melanopsichium pennsylvanicum]|uniref:Homeobox domain-containing protein n=2 Tax=Melanopsichium pennsylvanicum TaxID=63383 RepID=A0AAJ5C7F8_9BASI|nr:homeobox domain-containing protein [Melanopsichium pennsylvanicum 4]SNX86518.1 uncharacterized protein MEPE_05227 [Melanopsichium pennsylvanicum]